MRLRPDVTGLGAGLVALVVVGASIGAGSRLGRDYDLALLPYTFGVLFASFALAYRWAVWVQRPPTKMYWLQAGRLLFRREALAHLVFVARSTYENLVAQRFIRRRGTGRWVAHMCFAWGCALAGAVTFPLVFGWVHFETRPDDTHWYRVVALGHVVQEFHAQSITRYVMFNLLNVSAVMVIVGVGLALHRRLTEAEPRARQQFGNDLVPLLLLLAISVTGLMLTFSMHVLHGEGYAVVSLVHAIVVMATMIYMPFGKLFHVFQRPVHVAVALYRRADAAQAPAVCAACRQPYAGATQVADLKSVLRSVDLHWPLEGRAAHYADICPPCRRRLFGFTQGALLGRDGNKCDIEGMEG